MWKLDISKSLDPSQYTIFWISDSWVTFILIIWFSGRWWMWFLAIHSRILRSLWFLALNCYYTSVIALVWWTGDGNTSDSLKAGGSPKGNSLWELGLWELIRLRFWVQEHEGKYPSWAGYSEMPCGGQGLNSMNHLLETLTAESRLWSRLWISSYPGDFCFWKRLK